ncbi:NAD-binding protein [Aggregatilineales bacterium SYSU G02658]
MRIIMVGGDETVYYLARQFVRKGYHTTIINRDAQRARELANDTKATVVLGDGTHIQRMEEAGARQAELVLALTSRDQDNLIACQIAQRNFGVPRTIALVNDPDNEEVFHKLGVTHAFSATRIIASIIDQETDFDAIIQIAPVAKGRITISDVHLEKGAPAIGKTLQDLHLSGRTLIGAIIRDDHVIVPRGSTVLNERDHLIVISEPGYSERDLNLLCNHCE